ncbi:hypothetical protein [Pirellula sp. SH-Sr6A]|nr:hypothetical protein [Pirellula sp. SH-Sr6A]
MFLFDQAAQWLGDYLFAFSGELAAEGGGGLWSENRVVMDDAIQSS